MHAPPEFSLTEDDEVLHSRTLLLSDISDLQMARLRSARVLMVGAGGLGCPAAHALACAGLGHLHWIDPDVVAVSNLPRQTLFGPADVGRPKVEVGAERLASLAPGCKILAEQRAAEDQSIDDLVRRADLVMDCTDRFAVRQTIAAACLRLGRPLVSAAVIQWTGQSVVVHPDHLAEEGCYACLFDPGLDQVDAACGAFGVFPSAAIIMGGLQAHLALVELLGLPQPHRPLRLMDFREMQLQTIQRRQRLNCPVCSRLGAK